MSGYEPKAGDRVRVTEVVEGVVFDSSGDGLFVRTDGGRCYSYWLNNDRDGLTVSVERIPDPEPEYEPGDVVLDAQGDVFTRAFGSRWYQAGDPGTWPHDHPRRPLTLLVRYGKPVTGAQ